jgi:hypothetical protein
MEHKKHLIFIFIFILATKFISALSLQEIIPQGYEIRDSVSGHLNNDQFIDMIVVLKMNNEDSVAAKSEFAIKRETIILYGSANGYSVVARNMNAVYCVNCGGVMGDPFVGLYIENESFSISHYGGGVWRWGRVSTFSKNTKGLWVLTKDENETFSVENPDVTNESTITTPKDFGVITFEQYDIDKE